MQIVRKIKNIMSTLLTFDENIYRIQEALG